jgi:hypothetical protein
MIPDRDPWVDDTQTGRKKVCTGKLAWLILPHQNQTHCFVDLNREYLISPHFVCLRFDCTSYLC